MFSENTQFQWSDEKNIFLKQTRKISFENIIDLIGSDEHIATILHPDQTKYPGQYQIIVKIDGYVHYVPCMINNNTVFLKTIIPCRKLNKKYF